MNDDKVIVTQVNPSYISNLLNRIKELKTENVQLKESISYCSGSCRASVSVLQKSAENIPKL